MVPDLRQILCYTHHSASVNEWVMIHNGTFSRGKANTPKLETIGLVYVFSFWHIFHLFET